MRNRRDSRRDEGFTLVELTVVMLVLGVLAAIALPTFLNQRAKAYDAAMQSDLHSLVNAQAAWATEHATPTVDPTELAAQGYARSTGVSLPHVKVTAAAYVACVKHTSAQHWLVYDSTTGETTTSVNDCV